MPNLEQIPSSSLNEDTRSGGALSTLFALKKGREYALSVLDGETNIVLQKVDAPDHAQIPPYRYTTDKADKISTAFLLNVDPSITGAESALVVDEILDGFRKDTAAYTVRETEQAVTVSLR